MNKRTARSRPTGMENGTLSQRGFSDVPEGFTLVGRRYGNRYSTPKSR
ncbi:MAG: hypothetical protein HFJ85_04175 [Oscillospiraceae bacterium]|nr:hypothetical protein [Oscillospiraceae bacterium]